VFVVVRSVSGVPIVNPGSRRLSYAMAGTLASFGVAGGLLIVRIASGSVASVAEELIRNRLIYGYVFVASATAVLLFGRWTARQADLLRTLATTDSLTGLLNRRAIEERLQREYEAAKRYGLPLSVLIIDVDGLKRVNDLAGHAAGDEVLRGTADAIRQTLRASDDGARWGGDEFVVVAPHTSREAARRLADRLVVRVASAARTGRLATTVSVGIATLERGSMQTGALALVEEADRALYDAKEEGRGRVKAS